MGSMEIPLTLRMLFCPDPLDWVLDCEKDEDPTLVLLDAIKEEFLREVKVGQPKTKGKRELLNLENSVNYGDTKASVR
jgi:hypothetical protein